MNATKRLDQYILRLIFATHVSLSTCTSLVTNRSTIRRQITSLGPIWIKGFSQEFWRKTFQRKGMVWMRLERRIAEECLLCKTQEIKHPLAAKGIHLCRLSNSGALPLRSRCCVLLSSTNQVLGERVTTPWVPHYI